MDTIVSDPLLGVLVDRRYRIGPRIARGGMASVYEATDIRLDRTVALKILHPGLADDADFARRFVREARAAARLSHPNVVAVFDQGEDSCLLYLAMEYVPGQTLREVIRQRAPLRPAEALRLMEPILGALAAAHQAGVVHRDVKPENVLIAVDGQVKVADFGLARAISATSSGTATGGLLIGTVSYLAPELVVGAATDARCDVYAAGVLLYELLTGSKPHLGDSPLQVAYQHVHQDVPPPSRRQPAVPGVVDELVRVATARDPQQRPPDAGRLLREVHRALAALEHGARAAGGRGEDQGEPTLVVPPGAPVRGSPRRSRRLWLALAVIVLAAAAGAGGWYTAVGRYTVTPTVVQQPVAEARSVVRSAGLSFSVSGTDYSETVPAGHVLSTDPDPGERVLDNGTVSVVISKGPERYPVPAVAGLDRAAAVRKLTARKLHVETQRTHSETAPAGTVLSVSPEPGTSLRPGAGVLLTLSRGPAPVPVPDWRGENGTQAVERLQSLGFRVDVSRRHSSAIAEDVVISQRPWRGTGYRGDTVALVVSRGPQLVEVPDVYQDGVDAATATLRRAGFEVRVQQYYVTFGLGFVVRQSPSGGSLAPRGSTITVYVA